MGGAATCNELSAQAARVVTLVTVRDLAGQWFDEVSYYYFKPAINFMVV